jgi:hypothetical protein
VTDRDAPTEQAANAMPSFEVGDQQRREPSQSESAHASPGDRAAPGSEWPDPAPLRTDSPSSEDRLGRRPLARSLAIRLRQVWRDYQASGVPSSFVLHVHGPWGSGKTSFLDYLTDALTEKGQPKHGDTPSLADEPWVVVQFNAWQQQRVTPPWWPLLNTIYRDALRESKWPRKSWIWAREQWWRLMSARNNEILVGLSLVLVAAILWLPMTKNAIDAMARGDTLKELAGQADNVGKLLAFLGTVITIFAAIFRSLVSGSARAAQKFVDDAADPLAQIRHHFHDLVRWIGRPVLVVIDDVDRCQTSYVVALVEGIQTLFADSRVTYVLAGDGRWLYSCFEQAYAPFKEQVHEPGRSLGALFVEKVVQLTVPMPTLSPTVRKAYWSYVINGGPGNHQPASLDTRVSEIRRRISSAGTEAEVLQHAAEAKGDSDADFAVRAAAVERLAGTDIQAGDQYFLQIFEPYLDPNPRAMKRLLNAYAIQRDLAVLGGIDVLVQRNSRIQLALWTIVMMRWPNIVPHLVRDARSKLGAPPVEIAALLESETVGRVLKGEEVGIALDREKIVLFGGMNQLTDVL